MIEIKRKVHFRRGRRSRKAIEDGEAAPEAPVGRVPHISRLMALALRLDQLLRDGDVTDQAELARIGHVSRARLTQLMNLLCLAAGYSGAGSVSASDAARTGRGHRAGIAAACGGGGVREAEADVERSHVE